MIAGVYQIRHLGSGKLYVGSSIKLVVRKQEHWRLLLQGKHSNPHLQNAWNKHGADAFVFEALLYCDPKHCLMYEQISLDYLQPEYNIALYAKAPMLGRKHTQATKKRISQSNRNKHSTPLSQTHKDKISDSVSGDRNAMYGLRDKDHPAYGRKHTADELRQMGEARRGSKHPLARLDENQVRLIKKLLLSNKSCQEIANQFGVGRTTIGEIKAGRNWSHIS